MDKPPEFNGNETILEYMTRLNRWQDTQDKPKYELLLKYVNKLLKINTEKPLKRLTNVKNYRMDWLLKRPKYNRKVIKMFSSTNKCDR